MRRHRILIYFMTCSCLFFSELFAKVNIASDPTVAEVNGVSIKSSELKLYLDQAKLLHRPQEISKQKILQELIYRHLTLLKAQKNQLQNEQEIKYQIEEILLQAQIDHDLGPEIRQIEISDQEIKNYYQKNPEYRTAHIFFRLSTDPTAEEVNNQLQKAQAIYEKVRKNPQQFTEMANLYTPSNGPLNGGDLGHQPPGRLAPEYYAAIKGKKIGYLTPPIRTRLGIHIIKITSIRYFEQINKGIYKKMLYDQKRDDLLQTYFKNLKNSAQINIREEYL